MSVTTDTLIAAKYAPNSQTTEYTSTGLKTIIDKFGGFNGTGGAVDLTVNLVPNGGAAGASNVVMKKTIAAGEAYTFPEVVGHVLEAGGFISVLASAASSIVIRASGRKVT